MSLKFSLDGPLIPDALLDALQTGQVVFLCGAGISAPQLPGFGTLVKRVYERANISLNRAEEIALGRQRFEEAMGALARRVADKRIVYDTVETILRVPRAARLLNHKTILRLSRALDNSVALITTNFDTFFERAWLRSEPRDFVRKFSRSAPDLPSAGGADFRGIIHLHGRIADPHLGLERTGLVLTSAEYGDAYLRSGWASRFLFDLARCRTIVLIGYSANDAPVRYLLNVLEADRDRFPDLRTVYAFDGATPDDEDVEHLWRALAVTPLRYTKSKIGNDEDHSALWRDLDSLADLVEQPAVYRKRQLEAVIRRPFSSASAADLDMVNWLLVSGSELWGSVIDEVRDPAWLDHLIERRLITESLAGVAARWCSKDWTSRSRLYAATAWPARLGKGFQASLDFPLSLARPPQPWGRAWRTLMNSTNGRFPNLDRRALSLVRVVSQPDCLDADVRQAIGLFVPSIEVSPRDFEKPRRSPKAITDLLRIRYAVSERDSLPDLAKVLQRYPLALRTLAVGTDLLTSMIATARDIGLINGDYDSSDWDVPSVEKHRQNDFHDGYLPIIRLLAGAFSGAIDADGALLRMIADRWRILGSRIGTRLYLHALRDEKLFSANEAALALVNCSSSDFWGIRRETVKLVEDRLGKADPACIELLTDRILTEGPRRLRKRERGDSASVKWRPYARSQAIWLRLSALARITILSPSAASSLASIKAQYSHLSRDYTDRDLFSAWSGTSRELVGRPSKIATANVNERIKVARRLEKSWDFDDRESWGGFCQSDPEGAFESLALQGPILKNAQLWEQLLQAASNLQLGGPVSQSTSALLQRILDVVETASDSFVSATLDGLLWFLQRALSADCRVRKDWWDWLWNVARSLPVEETGMDGEELLSRAINSPAGKLAEVLLSDIQVYRRRHNGLTKSHRARLKEIVNTDGDARRVVYAVLTRHVGFLTRISPDLVKDRMSVFLGSDDADALACRMILMNYAPVGERATRLLKHAIMRGAEESTAEGDGATNVASKLLLPALACQLSKGKRDWGITASEVRPVLSRAKPGLRDGAARSLHHLLHGWRRSTGEVWRRGLAEVFSKAWPVERGLLASSMTGSLTALVAETGDAFPEALDAVAPYLVPFDRDWVSLFELRNSSAPAEFPKETLHLLWAVCRPPFKGQSSDLAEILDVIERMCPGLRLDRRFQWLEHRTARYN